MKVEDTPGGGKIVTCEAKGAAELEGVVDIESERYLKKNKAKSRVDNEALGVSFLIRSDKRAYHGLTLPGRFAGDANRRFFSAGAESSL